MRNLLSLFSSKAVAVKAVETTTVRARPTSSPFLALGNVLAHQRLDVLYGDLTHVMSQLLADSSNEALQQQKAELNARIEYVNNTWTAFKSKVRRNPNATISNAFADFKAELGKAEDFIWLAPQAA